MKNLLRAIQIFLKYGNPKYPTCCEHDTLHVVGMPIEKMTKKDIDKLDKLGFILDEEEGEFISFFFGSA